MRTAASAGMHPVGALWGFRSARELSESGARDLISRPEELLRFF
jgi:phosphoglycolate phosphatase